MRMRMRMRMKGKESLTYRKCLLMSLYFLSTIALTHKPSVLSSHPFRHHGTVINSNYIHVCKYVYATFRISDERV
ncbi:hypothetical protein BZA77DRAFT_305696 [Pyronema omphalodes]|nr:hypothetical protein BZA77DRAFT_305696 [Pyronema omphalodes]